MLRSEDNSGESIFSFHYVSPREGPKVIVLGRKVPLPTEPSFRLTLIMFWSKVSHRDLGLTVIRVGWLLSESQVSNLCLCRARDYKCTDALFCLVLFCFFEMGSEDQTQDPVFALQALNV